MRLRSCCHGVSARSFGLGGEGFVIFQRAAVTDVDALGH
jgi:hypothetical protein